MRQKHWSDTHVRAREASGMMPIHWMRACRLLWMKVKLFDKRMKRILNLSCRNVWSARHVGHSWQRHLPISNGAVRCPGRPTESSKSSSHSGTRECARHSIRRTRRQFSCVWQRRWTGQNNIHFIHYSVHQQPNNRIQSYRPIDNIGILKDYQALTVALRIYAVEHIKSEVKSHLDNKRLKTKWWCLMNIIW